MTEKLYKARPNGAAALLGILLMYIAAIFLLIFIMYTLGAIEQYDIFVRGNILMYFMILPFLLLFLQYIIGHSPLEVVLSDYCSTGFREIILYIMTFGVIMMSFKLYFEGYYRPMDSGMILGLKQAFGL